MINFNKIFRGSKEAQKNGWDEVAEMGKSSRFEVKTNVGATSPDVVRMQEQMRKMQEIQAARQKVMDSFDKNFDKMNKAAGVDRFGGRS